MGLTEAQIQIEQAWHRQLLDSIADVDFTVPTAERLASSVGSAALNRHDTLCRIWHSEEGSTTVTITTDERSAAVLVYAARLVASEWEAHAREVRTHAGQFSPGSYGQRNRMAIARRHLLLAERLRLVESTYRTEIDKDWWGI